MTPEQILTRLLGDGDLDEVVGAFSGTNPDHPDYRWDAAAKLRGQIIAIEGQIYCREEQVGRFLRKLHYAKGYRRAQHEIMEIERPHRGNRNGFHHYRQAFQFYARRDYRYIHLDADGIGPVIWPQFGFDLAARDHKARLRKILSLDGISLPEDIFVPSIAEIELYGIPIGQNALRRLRQLTARALPMILDLNDSDQRSFLAERALLDLPPLPTYNTLETDRYEKE